MYSLAELEDSVAVVHDAMPPTPQHRWPLLCERLGCDVWVKHENHTPIGAFKLRGGLVYLKELLASGEAINGIITATRGNHGQSVALAGQKHGVPVTVVVPYGNSTEKNTAMRAFGADLIEFGADFDEARVEADRIASERGLTFVPSFHRWLARGVGTYAYELFQAVRDLDTIYVPIGLGSGICGVISTRDALGLNTKVVGVVAENAPAYAMSFEAGEVRETNSASTFADGVACRVPAKEALDVIRRGADRIVKVSEDEIADAIRIYYSDTHNLVEGAGAASLAAAAKENDRVRGSRIGLVLTGGNIDAPIFQTILKGVTPGLSGTA